MEIGNGASTLQEAAHLRERISNLAEQIEVARIKLETIETRCNHQFTDSKRISERIGDSEGNVRWQRSCLHCGKKQETWRYKTERLEVPVYD